MCHNSLLQDTYIYKKVGCQLTCRMYFEKFVFHIKRIFNVISNVKILEYTLKL